LVLETTASAYDAPRFGRYAPLLLVAAGDLRHVFIAEHLAAVGPRRVVLHCLRSAGARNRSLRARFEEAAKRALRLCHPNLVHAHDADLTSATPFLVTEWLEGVSLAEFFATVGRTRLKLNELLWILTEVLSALCYLHELSNFDGSAAPVTHTEVTPSSIFLTSSGTVKLMNPGFRGLSSSAEVHAGFDSQNRFSDVGEVLAYAAPEQCLGLPVDQRADIYSVGALLWEVIAGRARSTGETHLSRAEARFLNREPSILEVWPNAPPMLAAICSRALEPSRDDRYVSARQFKEDLEQYLLSTGDEVGSRALGDVMRAEFSERFQALEADLAVTASPAPGAFGSGGGGPRGQSIRPPISLLAIAAPPSNRSIPPAEIEPREVTPPARRRWVVATALLFAFGVGGVVAWRKDAPTFTFQSGRPPAAKAAAPVASTASSAGLDAQSPAATLEPTRSIELDIATDPPGALFIDGKLIGASPFKGSVVADGREHILLATASGRVPEERVISYRSSVVLRFQLAKRREKASGAAAPQARE
jgi:serine/threonine protein kinase